MINLLRFEFRKFFKSTAFIVLLIVLAFLAAFYGGIMVIFDWVGGAEAAFSGLFLPEILGKNATMMAFSDIGDLSIIFAVVTALIITTDFKNDTIKNIVMYNYSRQKIFAAKSIVQAVIIALMLVFYIALIMVFFLIYKGWGEQFTFSSLWENFLKVFILGLILSYAITAFCNFLAYYTKSTVLVIVGIFVLSFISGIISAVFMFNSTSQFWEAVYHLTYTSVLSSLISDPGVENTIYYIITVSLLLFPSVILSMLKFQKQEI